MANSMQQGKEDQIPANYLVKKSVCIVLDTCANGGPFQNRRHCLANRENEDSEVEVENQGSSVRQGQGDPGSRPSNGKMSFGIGNPEVVREDDDVKKCEHGTEEISRACDDHPMTDSCSLL